MEFRLTYQGPLLSDRDDVKKSRLIHKHEIRRTFHKQLANLWEVNQKLNSYQRAKLQWPTPEGGIEVASRLEHLAKNFYQHGVQWVPLVNEVWGVACSLDILFLRREPKGGIVQGGDLDNRIKLLFDSLRIPKGNEVPDPFDANLEPRPFFCLLSDDQLITEFRVNADRLLVPPQSESSGAEVHLVIEVKTFISDPFKADFTLGSEIHS
jgi:hypothetical protein